MLHSSIPLYHIFYPFQQSLLLPLFPFTTFTLIILSLPKWIIHSPLKPSLKYSNLHYYILTKKSFVQLFTIFLRFHVEFKNLQCSLFYSYIMGVSLYFTWPWFLNCGCEWVIMLSFTISLKCQCLCNELSIHSLISLGSLFSSHKSSISMVSGILPLFIQFRSRNRWTERTWTLPSWLLHDGSSN